MTKTFKILYFKLDANGETWLAMEVKSFSDCLEISAREWAEDYAYTVADKGWYEVDELT